MGFTTLFNIQNNMQMQCNYRNVLYTYILKRNKYFDTILIEFTRKYLKTKLAYYLLTKILKRNVNRQKRNGYLPSLIAKSQIKANWKPMTFIKWGKQNQMMTDFFFD